jgi:ATPase family associated with various cellular activities (AAA)
MGNQEPEIADVARLARRFLNRAVETARAPDRPLRRVLLDHLGDDAAALPTVSASWPPYEHVNVQIGLDAWLAASPVRQHTVIGVVGVGYMRHMDVSITDFIVPSRDVFSGAGAGGVVTTAVPCGPGGQARACVSNGIYLVHDGGVPLAIMLQPSDRGPMHAEVVLQVAGADAKRIEAVLEEIRQIATENSVFRGQVISIQPEVFGPAATQRAISFLERPMVTRDQIVLPEALLAEIERQVIGIGRHSRRLLASGQHLKRGVLLHGAPGTGKTHTVSYLLGLLPDVTVIEISGKALGRITEACSVARSLQPAVIVVEDVDLIAEERTARPGEHPLLFQLLNEMEGLNSATDIAFILTTNRADLLEPALAARPGRVDLAAELPLPGADARRALIRLYRGNLVLDADLDGVIERTEGVTAAFLKELLRKAALLSAESDAGAADSGTPIRVTGEHLTAALEQLFDARSHLTRAILGGPPARHDGQGAHPAPGTD